MLELDEYEYIRVAHRVHGKGIREIARDTGHSKNTVKEVLKREYKGYSARKSQSYPALGNCYKARWQLRLYDDELRNLSTGLY